MNTILAFDIYGTLIDTNNVAKQLNRYIGDQAAAFSTLWRDKQLEYSFRRGLMQRYENFATCTRDALEYTDSFFSSGLSAEQKQGLLDSYQVLPSFDNVENSLKTLKTQNVSLYAFSNGPAAAVQQLLDNADLSAYFLDIISTDEIQSFKPNPAVYHHLLERTKGIAQNTWLISSNSFDVLGAKSAGLKAAWLKRSPDAILDPWELEPDAVINELSDLIDLI